MIPLAIVTGSDKLEVRWCPGMGGLYQSNLQERNHWYSFHPAGACVLRWRSGDLSNLRCSSVEPQITNVPSSGFYSLSFLALPPQLHVP